MIVWHDMTAEQILERVQQWWDLSAPLPLPRRTVACPVCRSEETIIRHWAFHKHEPSRTTPWRVDISFKCTQCSHVFVFGIAVSEEYWRRFPAESLRGHTGRKVLEQHQEEEDRKGKKYRTELCDGGLNIRHVEITEGEENNGMPKLQE